MRFVSWKGHADSEILISTCEISRLRTGSRNSGQNTQTSSPLADVFSEVALFSMDRAVTRHVKGVNLHRLHDDF